MNPMFAEMVEKNTPNIDPRIGYGLSHHESKNIPAYVDRIFRINSAGFPSGLTYLGYQEVSPKKGYAYMTRMAKTNSRNYDINRNDIRLYVFKFDYKGRPIEKYIYLPFIRRHGFMWMNGVKYIVSPVVADGTITVKPTEIFVKLIKIKFWFEKINEYRFLADGNMEYTSVYFAKIHNKQAETQKSFKAIKIESTIVHYLCCKFGLTETLRKFGFQPEDWAMLHKDDYAEMKNTYPPENWIVLSSTGKKPAHSYRASLYKPSELLFVVRRDKWETIRSAKTVFGTLIYVLSHYTDLRRMNPHEYDDTELWCSMMGESICSHNEKYQVIKTTIDKHMSSLDGYVDDMVIDDFKRMDLGFITDIYKLFVYIVENFVDLTSQVSQAKLSNSLYGKQLQVLPFLLFDLIKVINRAYFALSELKLKEQEDPTTEIKFEAVEKALNAIKANTIRNIRSHTEIIVAEDPTDLPLLKLGRIIVLQEKSDKQRTANVSTQNVTINSAFHESLLELGAVFDMTKSNPHGLNRLNVFVNLTDDFTIAPNPELKPLLDKVRAAIYGPESEV